jgi:alkyl hydroperoxide reductase subunit AhpC
VGRRCSINELSNVNVKFPIIADPSREIAKLYDMLGGSSTCLVV